MRKKILVCDDDAGILEVVKIVLEDKGYEVITFADGILEKVAQKIKPALLIIDIWIGKADGSKSVKKLKQLENFRNIPMVLFSALTDGRKIAEECGADDFLAKPFEIKDLVDKVEKYLN